MHKEGLRAIAEDAISRAKELMGEDKALAPVILAVGGGSVVPSVIGPDMTKEDSAELIKTLSEASEGIIFLTDAYSVDIKEGETVPENLAEHPSACDSLICIIYSKEYVGMRRILYDYANDTFNTRLDMGWEDNPPMERTSRFFNPYMK